MSDCNHENYFMNENCYVCDLESEIQQLEEENKILRERVDMYKKCSCGCYHSCDIRNKARKTLAKIKESDV